MNTIEFQKWLQLRSRATRLFIGFGKVSVLLALVLWLPQHMIWRLAGWGSANFLPDWTLILIYGFSSAVGVTLFYFYLLKMSFLEKKTRWVTSAFAGICTACIMAAALGNSIPQLSTLLVSSQVEARLQIYSNGDGRRCRGSVIFGPIYKIPGAMCTGFKYWQKGSYRVFKGQGNAIAMRIESF